MGEARPAAAILALISLRPFTSTCERLRIVLADITALLVVGM
jgi:hypothetical protein